MKSIEWIDKLIREKKLPSDRQAALLIGMTVTAMSSHRVGRTTTLDDKYAYKLEELLNLPHGKIVADQHAERASDPKISAMWRKLAASAAVLTILSVGILQTGNNSNVADSYAEGKSEFCILC